jgi:hypothetical protein
MRSFFVVEIHHISNFLVKSYSRFAGAGKEYFFQGVGGGFLSSGGAAAELAEVSSLWQALQNGCACRFSRWEKVQKQFVGVCSAWEAVQNDSAGVFRRWKR